MRRVSTAAVALLLSLGLPARAGAEQLGKAVGIEDPSGKALHRLHEALRGVKGGGRARLLFYGDSHTSLDQYTGELRSRLQARFGDGGPGLVLPVTPFRSYHHRRARVAEGGAWTILRVKGRSRDPEAYGVAGLAAETNGRAWGAVEPLGGKGISRAKILFLRRPGGGSVQVRVNGTALRRVRTAGRHRGLGSAVVVVPGGRLDRIELRALGDGPVRLFGTSLERDGAGVVVDALGIPSARGRDMLPWDEGVQRQGLRLLAPDLVTLAYGTNESGGDRQSMRRYEQDLRRVVRRVTRAAPEASCLLMGPTDWCERRRDGEWAPRERTSAIVEAQRRVAAAEGCGYFDVVAFQGGAGSMPRWVEAGLAHDDHAHLTDGGHLRLAEVLEAALLAGLDPPSE